MKNNKNCWQTNCKANFSTFCKKMLSAEKRKKKLCKQDFPSSKQKECAGNAFRASCKQNSEKKIIYARLVSSNYESFWQAAKLKAVPRERLSASQGT